MDYLETKLKKTESIVARKIGDEVILVPIRNDVADLQSIYTLNEIGAIIWDLLNGKRSGQEILDTLVNEYDIKPEEAKGDIIAFLEQLESIKAIKSTG